VQHGLELVHGSRYGSDTDFIANQRHNDRATALQTQGFAVLGGDAEASSWVDPGYVRIHPIPRELGTGEP